MLEGWFLWFILFWVFFMIVSFGVGGFFMFRKFLKKFPKEDGKSEMDWQEHYLRKTSHLWDNDEKQLLEDLVSPVPELFRDAARNTIASKIGELAMNEQRNTINRDLVIRGYILATPKRDHRFLRKKLKEKNIDTNQYLHLFK